MGGKSVKQQNGYACTGFMAVFLLLLALWTVFAREWEAYAASVTITFSTDKEEVRVGDVVEVTMTLTSTDTMGDFEAYLNYDSTVLEFSSAPACIQGGGGRLRISDIGASASRQERSYKIRFLAAEPGSCSVSLYERPIVYGYSDGIEMSVTSVSKVITVLPAENASSNSRLSVLRILDGATQAVPLTPEFSPEVDTYFSAVPYDTTDLILSAIAEDSRSSVVVSGQQKLQFGSNEVNITVTAENGSVTKYTVYVYREPEPTRAPLPEKPETVPGVQFALGERAVLVTEYHTYTAVKRPESLLVPEGYEATYLFLNEIQVEAYAKKEAGSEELLLLVLRNEAGETNWYSYDRIEQTIQRVQDERFVIQQIVEAQDDALVKAVEQYKSNQELLLLVLALLCGFCLLLLALVVWLVLKRRRTR